VVATQRGPTGDGEDPPRLAPAQRRPERDHRGPAGLEDHGHAARAVLDPTAEGGGEQPVRRRLGLRGGRRRHRRVGAQGPVAVASRQHHQVGSEELASHPEVLGAQVVEVVRDRGRARGDPS
jgi:hypothetical protein